MSNSSAELNNASAQPMGVDLDEKALDIDKETSKAWDRLKLVSQMDRWQYQLIEAKIDDQFVKKLKVPGRPDQAYIQDKYIVTQLNRIFGHDNWDFELPQVDVVHQGPCVVKKYNPETRRNDGEGPGFSVTVVVRGRLIIKLRNRTIVRENVGAQTIAAGIDNIGATFENATKAAATDAIKRCAKLIGRSLGLLLAEPNPEMYSLEDEDPNEPMGGNPQPSGAPARNGGGQQRPTNPQNARPQANQQQARPQGSGQGNGQGNRANNQPQGNSQNAQQPPAQNSRQVLPEENQQRNGYVPPRPNQPAQGQNNRPAGQQATSSPNQQAGANGGTQGYRPPQPGNGGSHNAGGQAGYQNQRPTGNHANGGNGQSSAPHRATVNTRPASPPQSAGPASTNGPSTTQQDFRSETGLPHVDTQHEAGLAPLEFNLFGLEHDGLAEYTNEWLIGADTQAMVNLFNKIAMELRPQAKTLEEVDGLYRFTQRLADIIVSGQIENANLPPWIKQIVERLNKRAKELDATQTSRYPTIAFHLGTQA